MKPEEAAAHIAAVEEHGYTIVENAIEPDLIDRLNDTLLRLEREMNVVPAKNSFEGHHTVRIYNLLLDPVFRRIPVHASVLPVVEGVLTMAAPSPPSISIDPAKPRSRFMPTIRMPPRSHISPLSATHGR